MFNVIETLNVEFEIKHVYIKFYFKLKILLVEMCFHNQI